MDNKKINKNNISHDVGQIADKIRLALDGDRKVSRLMDSVSNTMDEYTKEVSDQRNLITDSFGNSLSASGTDDKVASFNTYDFSNNSLNYLLWLSLYNDSWVFRRAIDKPAEDEIKCSLKLSGDSDKSTVQSLIKKARFDLIKLLQWGALFGGSVAVIMFDTFNDDDYKNSIKKNKNKITNAKTVRYYVTDRWYGCQQSTDTVTDMSSLDYGKPKKYTITFANGHQLDVHHDYILRYEHRTAPQLIKTGQLQGWGYAEGAHILNELSRDDELRSSIQSLINKSLIEVVKMSGMRGVFMGQDEQSNQQLEKRLEMVNWARTYNSLTLLDKDDDYSINEYSGLSGLSDLLTNEMWMISAALDMQGILFGDLKTGFANDTDAMERYAETIKGRCESFVRPVYAKLLKIFYMICKIDEPVDFEFESLIEDKHQDEKIDRISKFTDLIVKLMDSGIIDEEVALTSFKDYTSTGAVNFNISDEKQEELLQNYEEQNEAFDINSEDPENNSTNIENSNTKSDDQDQDDGDDYE